MERDLGLFARWILKHYETSDVGGYFCWRNPMGDIVSEVDIVNHYIEDQKPEMAETKKLVEKFADKINNMQDLDPEYNEIISQNFDYLTSSKKLPPPPPPSRVIKEGQIPTPPNIQQQNN
jgi:hypothetical protein